MGASKDHCREAKVAYDQQLAERIRVFLAESPSFTLRVIATEKKMFGGLSFMFHGNLGCGVIGDELIVRVGPEGFVDALAHPHARAFDFTGRPMKGWVTVAPEGLDSEAELESWVLLGATFASNLAPK